ncbi:MAG: DMT family transporter [Pseudomonadota bacterium]|nr:DMT family transporter [Pseudomonadota bacterium]
MRIALSYIAIVLIWTTTPLAIKWSADTDWFFGVAARTALGAVIILPLLYWSKKHFSIQWPALKVYMAASIPVLGGMTAMYWSAQYLPSGWIAMIFALSPVLTGLFAHYCLPNNQLTSRKLFGVLIALSGLWIIFGPNLQTDMLELQLIAIGIAFLSVLLHSYGTVLVKRMDHNLPSLHVVIGALWVTVVGHLIISPETLFYWPEITTRESWTILYAASIGSVFGFLLYFYLLKNVDAIKVGLIPVITPVFALLLGHWLNDETLNATVWFGAGLVTFGLIVFEVRFIALWNRLPLRR